MRAKRFIHVTVLLGALVLVGAGCAQKAAAPSTNAPAAEKAAVPAEKPSTATADVCGNPYYPFKPGLTIAYSVTPFIKTAGDADYTIRTVSVTGTVAAIRAEMAGGINADMEADCSSGSVAMKGTFDVGAAAQGMKFKTTVISSSGTFMPAKVAAGTTWKNTQKVSMEATSGPTAGMGPVSVTTTEESRVVGEESVTVPAGTYQAVKVELTRTTATELSGPPPGVKLPPGMKLPETPPTVTTSTEWWVKGIGMVKTVTVSNSGTSTVEAKSVTGL